MGNPIGRPPTGYTERLGTFLRPETARAVEALAASSGLSKTHVLRLAIEAYLVDAGVLLPADLPPTTFKKHKEMSN